MTEAVSRKAGRLPPWIRIKLETGGCFGHVGKAVQMGGLHTVCQSAMCPNRHECWNAGTATFMIMGNICSRDCRFCAVQHGEPSPLDPAEPERVADAVEQMGLTYAVITSVTRDDLPDGGAGHFSLVVRALRERVPQLRVEVLTSDFQGRMDDVDLVLRSGVDVFNHNVETVPRLQASIRPSASYDCSLSVLRHAADQGCVRVKSGLMVGLGETDEEVLSTMKAVHDAGCRLLTIGQYLAPGRRHAAVARYVHPDVFEMYRAEALSMGFDDCASGPLVRSSYHAEHLATGRDGAH